MTVRWIKESVLSGPVGLGVSIPAGCYSGGNWTSAFKTCHDNALKQAQTKAYAEKAAADADPNGPAGLMWKSQYGGDFNKAVNYYFEPLLNACIATHCSKDQPAATHVWGAKSAATTQLQQQLNVKLEAEGYHPISVDGYLGPATCGAAYTVWPEMEPMACKSRTMPTPKDQPAPVPQPPPPPAPKEEPPPPVTTTTTAKKKTPWALILGLGFGGAGLAWFVADQEKKKRGLR